MGASLVDIRLWMTRYIMSLFLACGLLGNMINILTFRRREYLNHSCSRYLFVAAILNLFTISWGIGPALYNLDHVDPLTYSFVYCKIRLYTIHTMLMIGRTLTVLACMDRFALCSGSAKLRNFSRPKVAVICIIITFLVWPILTCHITIMTNFTGTRCVRVGVYVLIHGIYATLAAGICPPSLMTIFSLLIIKHRRELQQRLNISRKENRRDQAMSVMLISEVIVYVTSTIMYPTITLYLAITNQNSKSDQQRQIESFLSFVGGSFLVYLNPSASFYVYILSSKSYRMEVKITLINLVRKLLGRKPVRINPGATQMNTATVVNNRSMMRT